MISEQIIPSFVFNNIWRCQLWLTTCHLSESIRSLRAANYLLMVMSVNVKIRYSTRLASVITQQMCWNVTLSISNDFIFRHWWQVWIFWYIFKPKSLSIYIPNHHMKMGDTKQILYLWQNDIYFVSWCFKKTFLEMSPLWESARLANIRSVDVGIDHVFASGAVVGRATTHEWGRPSLRAII